MSMTLLAALATLVLWIILAFVVALPTGLIHVLLALSVTLLVRWYALQH